MNVSTYFRSVSLVTEWLHFIRISGDVRCTFASFARPQLTQIFVVGRHRFCPLSIPRISSCSILPKRLRWFQNSSPLLLTAFKCVCKVSEPVVSFRETIVGESDQVCLSKSPNKHNRIFAKSQPLDDELCNDIENNKVYEPTPSSRFQPVLYSRKNVFF